MQAQTQTRTQRDELQSLRDQMRAQYNAIVAAFAAFDGDTEPDEAEGHPKAGDDEALQTWAESDALSVEVRSDWHSLGDEDNGLTHYKIVLCCGGPHVEIKGELSEHGAPSSAKLLGADWGNNLDTYWHADVEGVLLRFAGLFYFGE